MQVFSLDKFPRMTDYVTPSGVRVADADRVRLGAHLADGTTVMHEGFVNYNAGTLGHSMVEGRISAGVVVGDGSDVGGGSSSWARSRRRRGGHQHRRALPARRQRRDRHLARRRLHGRGRALRHRRHADHAPGRRRRQRPRAQRRQRPAVPPQLQDRHGRGAAALRQVGRAQRGAARERLTISSASAAAAAPSRRAAGRASAISNPRGVAHRHRDQRVSSTRTPRAAARPPARCARGRGSSGCR